MAGKKIIIISGLLIALSIPLTLTLLKQQSNKNTHAASPDQLEAEGGIPAGNAVTKQDSQASGGSYVLFGENSNPSAPTKTVTSLCNESYAPGSANWISFATFNPSNNGSTDVSSKLASAMQSAMDSGKCLQIPSGTYLLTTNIHQKIPAGKKLVVWSDGTAIFKRISDSGTIYFEADLVLQKTLTGTVSIGDEGVTVNDVSGIMPGDIVEINAQLSMSPGSGWSHFMGESATVASIQGNRILFPSGWKTNYRFHPKRAIAYKMDGTTKTLLYRAWWLPQNDVEAVGGGTYTVSGNTNGYCTNEGCNVTFNSTPPAGTIVTLRTKSDIPVDIYRGGDLLIDGLHWTGDAATAPNMVAIGNSITPSGSVFRNLNIIQNNQALDPDGFPTPSGSADFISPWIINGLIENITVEGGRYPVMPSGRNNIIRNINGHLTWDTVAIFFSTSHTYIENVTADLCDTAVDGHMTNYMFVRNVTSTNCRMGVDHRTNGGSMSDVHAEGTVGSLSMGGASGTIVNDTLVADPKDNPTNFYRSDITTDLQNNTLIENSTLKGISIRGNQLNNLTINNVTTDKDLEIDGRFDVSPVWELVIDGLTLGDLANVRIARKWTINNLHAKGIYAVWSGENGATIKNSVIDGKGSTYLIEDGGGNHRTATNVTFKNATRLFANPNDLQYWTFINCTFDPNLNPF